MFSICLFTFVLFISYFVFQYVNILSKYDKSNKVDKLIKINKFLNYVYNVKVISFQLNNRISYMICRVGNHFVLNLRHSIKEQVPKDKTTWLWEHLAPFFCNLSNIDRDTTGKRIINLLRIFYNFTISFIYIFMNFYKRPFDIFSDVNNDLQEYSFEYFLLNIQALIISFFFFFRINFVMIREVSCL